MNSPEPIFFNANQSSSDALDDAQRLSDELIARVKLGEVLRKLKAIDDSGLERIVTHQRSTGQLFGQAAVALKLVDESTVARALAEQEQLAVDESVSGALSKELIAAHEPFNPEVESLRSLRTRLLVELRRDSREGGARSIALVSADQGEGRSWLAGNLSVAFAQLGTITVLIDADLRRPRQHQLFGHPDHDGLVSWLSGRSERPAIRRVESVANLHLLPAGSRPPNPQELLSGDTFSRSLGFMSREAQFLIVDTPPASLYADYTFAALAADAVVLVVRRRTAVRRVQALVEQLRVLGRAPIGIVFNSR